MKIGVDIRLFAKGGRTGIEDYTINLLSNLLPVDESVKYRLFYNSFRNPNLDYSFLKSPNVRLKKYRIPNRIFDLFLRIFKFPKLDKLLGSVDIFFSPHFLLAPISKAKRVIVFYDLTFIHFPKFFSLKKLFWHRFMYSKKQAQEADLIVAISESTKKDLINFYKIRPEKIKVIYPGIDKKFKPINRDDPNLLRVAEKYKLSEKFILYFGTIEPRKNIIGLIRAFEQIKKMPALRGEVKWWGFEGSVKAHKQRFFDFSNLKLVIAGAKGWLYKEVFKTAKNSKFKKDIIFTDFIDEEDKVYLYNLAELFVYPSFFEGFGLPPLEAMACGIPVIVSNKSSLPEVVGKGAIMIDPDNIDEISFAIQEILDNQDLKEYLIKRGLERIRQFDWQIAVKGFLKLFKSL